jgi:pyridoxine kinase
MALGHEVIALPTILLSNHPGHPHVAGEPVAPALLHRMLDAIEANGWLGEVHKIITGYLPSVEHVRFAADVLERRRQPGVTYICDPVLGDDPKGLYIAHDAAAAIRELLIPRASIVTPNRFELAFLSGLPVDSCEAAMAAIRAMGPPLTTIAKSLSGPGPDEMWNLFAFQSVEYSRTRIARRQHAPHGTGDLMAALIAASPPGGTDGGARIMAAIDRVLAASEGLDELALEALPHAIDDVAPLPTEFNPRFREESEARARCKP